MQAIDSSRESPKSIMEKHDTDYFFESDNLGEHTTIEMTGADRPGLFSEISAALADLHCNVVEAHAWSHNARLACVAYISDQSTHTHIDDPKRLAIIEDHLTTVLRATTNPNFSTPYSNQQEVKTSDIHGGEIGTMSNVERRLHQLMLSVRDFDGPLGSISPLSMPVGSQGDHEHERGLMKTVVSIESCDEREYSIVSLKAKDRPRLMFDTVCTLTDLQYVVFHASTASHGGYALQVMFHRPFTHIYKYL